MRVHRGLCVEGNDAETGIGKDHNALTFRNEEGHPVIWVFPSPGRVWKDRWVAFTNGNEFQYHKGSREEVVRWAEHYMSERENCGTNQAPGLLFGAIQ